tara:strand:+ start:1111 stop:1827 length:717 start_codon:yes stop_codon:yes gene_type:complete
MEREILAEYGLTKNEIDIFIILVKKGTLSPTSIAKETGLNRPYVYYALERLLEKGYLSQITIKGKKHFQAIELNHIASLEELKLENLKKVLSDLKEFQQKGEDIIVEVLKGKYVVKNIFKNIFSEIKPKQEILYLGLDEEKMESLEPIYIKKLLNYFSKKQITERIIVKTGGKKLEYAKTSSYRHLDPELLGNTARIIYQDNVVDLLYGTPIYGIITKNSNLANTARKQFELFWGNAK